jgi:sugar lactone lactonase YvrE
VRVRGSPLATLCLLLPVAGAAADVSVLVPPGVMHAVEGIAFDDAGTLYGTSIHGQSVYRIDVATGAVTLAVGPPHGEADDVAIGPAGTPVAGVLAWSAQRSGEIRIRRPGGPVETVLRNAPRVNPIAFSADGRLFTAQSGAGDESVWEIDLVGGRAPRVVLKGQRTNGFDFGPDGILYAPHFGTNELLAIDVDAGQARVIARGVGSPAAVRIDGRGDLLSVDYMTGDIWHTDRRTRESRVLAQVREPIDSLAVGRDGTLYVASVAESAIDAVDPATGASRRVVPGYFTTPLGMTMTTRSGRPALLVADPFGYRWVDVATGKVDRPFWAANRGASSAIAVDGRFVAFTYSESTRIRKIDLEADRVVAEFRTLKAPRGIAFAPGGDLVVADAATGRLVRLRGDGSDGEAAVREIAKHLREPVGVAADSPQRSGAAVLVTERAAGTVVRIDLATGRRSVLAEHLSRPSAAARLPDGRVAVVEPDLGRVVAVDPRSGVRDILARGLALSLKGIDFPANTNTGLAVGSDGAVHVACAGDNSIVTIAAEAVARTRHARP